MRKAYRDLSKSGQYKRRQMLRIRRIGNDEDVEQPCIEGNDQHHDLEQIDLNLSFNAGSDFLRNRIADDPEPEAANNSDGYSNDTDEDRSTQHEESGNESSDSSGNDTDDCINSDDGGGDNRDYDELEEDAILNGGIDDDTFEKFIASYKEPLYRGAPLTVEKSLLLILALVLKHNLNGAVIEDILMIINLHCLTQDLKKMSLYHFKKCFSLGKAPYIKYYYCSHCYSSLGNEKSNCSKCPRSKNNPYFIQLSIKSQLEEMLSRDGFYNCLQHKFNRQKIHEEHIEDMYDGELYRELQQAGYLMDPNEISMTWFTDGVPIFKSSKLSMWPLYLRINELPYEQRILRENTIIAGLWFGTEKPNANLFIKSCHSDFTELFGGINCKIPGGEILKITSILLCGVCDLPAKALFMNMKSFNADYGCCHCEEKGENMKLESGGHTHIYPYNDNLTMRTKEKTIAHAEKAHNLNKNNKNKDVLHEKGIKGPCALNPVMPDYVIGCGIDVMHSVDEGVFKKLLKLWFDPRFNENGFSLRNVTELIDEKTTHVKFPKFVHRAQRKVSDYVHWKASEIKNFFFYVAPIILSEFMRPHLFAHFLLLIHAMSLLMSESISMNDISIANGLLNSFVAEFPTYYGLQHCSINLHLLLHLADSVKKFGPLWVLSCYSFEDMNGQILKLIHGTKSVESQVANSHFQLLSFTKKFLQLPAGPLRDFAVRRKKQVAIRENCGLFNTVGSYVRLRNLTGLVKNAMKDVEILPGAVLHKYYRLLKNRLLYVSASYPRSLKSNSSFIMYHRNDKKFIGRIYNFVKLSYCKCVNHRCQCIGKHFAIVQEVISQGELRDGFSHTSLRYLHQCYIGERVSAVPVENLLCVCFYMNINSQSYVAQPINVIEHE